jgi:hypothetical protein
MYVALPSVAARADGPAQLRRVSSLLLNLANRIALGYLW